MQTVFKNSQLAHVWANQTQETGRGNGAVSFSGPVFFSYATPIAVILDSPRVALISSHQYSVTTSKHQNEAAGAVRGIMPFFTVPSIGAPGGRNSDSTAPRHAENLEHLTAAYRKTVKRLSNPRTWVPDDGGRNWLERDAGKVAEYAQLFSLAVDPLPINEDITAIAAARAKSSSPEAAAKREKARQRLYMDAQRPRYPLGPFSD